MVKKIRNIDPLLHHPLQVIIPTHIQYIVFCFYVYIFTLN